MLYWFQFLIGSLRTIELEIDRSDKSEFQFLIGSLRTLSFGDCHLQMLKFQFLIGSLRTLIFLQGNNVNVLVSIPHRQSKNEEFIFTITDNDRFQFLIGSLRTKQQTENKKTYQICFNSS